MDKMNDHEPLSAAQSFSFNQASPQAAGFVQMDSSVKTTACLESGVTNVTCLP